MIGFTANFVVVRNATPDLGGFGTYKHGAELLIGYSEII